MKTKVQKIALVGNHARWVYQFRLGLLKKLKELGLKVVVLANPDPFEQKLQKEGIDFEPIHINFYGNNPLQDLRLAFQLFRLYRKHRFDHIIHFTIKPNIFGGLAARFAGIPSFAVVTGLGHVMNEKNPPSSRIGRFLYKVTLGLHKKVIVLNEQDAEDLIGRHMVKPGRLELLPGEGVDTQFYRPLSDKKMRDYPAFLFSGRLIRDKGIFEFVEAARIIKARYPETRFRILGMLDPLGIHSLPVSTLQEWVRQGWIEYIGETVDVRPYVAKADCLVLPSYYREGMSRVLMEAASMETPIITTRQPGCQEMVDDGRTGLLCKSRNPQDLAEKMEQFIRMDKIDRLIMGKNARIKMQREFEERFIIQRYLDLLSETLNLQLPDTVSSLIK
ncbi:MAG TPA: glycosyltransferase family 4 protein [Flavilitoribacter sp.]|nr:glycosyltransferase family 4 protein [Flavilitoribacter sp.]HMQ87455.1 glycosyltransferase family 4 protein [Flavilitoribacter sp.]